MKRRAVENRCVFGARLKALRSGDRSVGGRRFHVAGPLMLNFVVQLQSGRVEPVECQSLQIADEMAVTSGYAEVAEIGWSDTMNTPPDRGGATVLKVAGDNFASGASQKNFGPPLFGQLGGQNIA